MRRLCQPYVASRLRPEQGKKGRDIKYKKVGMSYRKISETGTVTCGVVLQDYRIGWKAESDMSVNWKSHMDVPTSPTIVPIPFYFVSTTAAVRLQRFHCSFTIAQTPSEGNPAGSPCEYFLPLFSHGWYAFSIFWAIAIRQVFPLLLQRLPFEVFFIYQLCCPGPNDGIFLILFCYRCPIFIVLTRPSNLSRVETPSTPRRKLTVTSALIIEHSVWMHIYVNCKCGSFRYSENL